MRSAPAKTLFTVRPATGGSSLGGVAVLLAVVVVLYFGRDVFVPLALATLLSFMLAPLVIRLRRLKLPRALAITVVVAFVMSAIGAIGTVATNQIASLADNMPRYERNIEAKLRSLRDSLPSGALLDRASNMLKEAPPDQAGASEPAAGSAGLEGLRTGEDGQPVTVRLAEETTHFEVLMSVVAPVLGPFGTAGLVLVFVILILFEREDLRDRVIHLAGGDLHRTTQAINDAALRVSRYLLMQLIINATYGVAIGTGLFVIGVPNPVLWGLLAALLRFVPYAGPFIAAAFPIALSLAVDPGWTIPLLTVALFLLAELVSNNVLEPWLYGSSTGLSAVAIIAAAVFWTSLWGPVGLLLATPLTVCLVVLGRHVPQLQFLGVLLGNEPALSIEARFYQRILASDPDEAADLAALFLKEHSLVALCDEVIMPALALAEQDRQGGALNEDRERLIADAIPEILEDLIEDEDNGPVASGSSEDGATILCLAGRTQFDESAARVLAQLLEHNGMPARAVRAKDTVTGRLAELGVDRASLVCASHLHPSAISQARQLCKRLRRHGGSNLTILACLWNAAREVKPDRDAAAAVTTTADMVVTTLKEALDYAKQHAEAEITAPMEPAPVAPNEGERLDELKRFDLLDTEPEEAFDRVTSELARIFKTSISLISLIDEARQFWKSAVGLPDELAARRQSDRGTSICGHVVANNEVLVIEDVRRDKRFANNPFLKEHGIRFYAGAPLTTRSGHAIGSICVIDKKPRKLTLQEIGLLRLVADGVMTEIELRSVAKESALATDRLERWDKARQRDMQLAQAVRRILLPPRQQSGPTYLLSHGYRPRADRGADLVDVQVMPDGRAALLLGDLCGEGPSAALFTVLVKSAFAKAAQARPEPASVLAAVNVELAAVAQGNDRITALVALFDPESGTLSMAVAGHPAPIVLRDKTAREVQLRSGPPLMATLEATYHPKTVDLSTGDRVIFFTDGAVEVALEDGGLLGTAGLSQLVEETADHHGRGFVDRIMAALCSMEQDLEDDLTLVVLECKDPTVEPTISSKDTVNAGSGRPVAAGDSGGRPEGGAGTTS